jgi:hypothetical protein
MNHYLTKKIIYDGIEITDIFRKFQFIEKYKIDSNYYIEYAVKNGDTPETVSNDFYNTTDFWWIICLYNEIYDPFYDWPMSQLDLERYAKKLVPTWQVNPVGYLIKIEELTEKNELHRNIKIPKESIINKIVLEIKEFYK